MALTRRQRRAVFRGVQYALLLGVVAIAAFTANRPAKETPPNSLTITGTARARTASDSAGESDSSLPCGPGRSTSVRTASTMSWTAIADSSRPKTLVTNCSSAFGTSRATRPATRLPRPRLAWIVKRDACGEFKTNTVERKELS